MSYEILLSHGQKETRTFFAFVRVFFRPCGIFNLVMFNDYVDGKLLLDNISDINVARISCWGMENRPVQ